MSILLVRHGETPLNASRVLQPPNTPLSERGSAQARAVGERLASTQLAGVLASDLRRAYETAGPIAAAHGLPIQTSPLLHERNFGLLRGLPYDTMGYNPIEMEGAPPGGESMPEFLARVARAFEAMVALRARLSGPLAVVSHGLVIKSILRHHVHLPDGMPPPERIGNTSVTVIEPNAPYRASLIDCTTHLAGRIGDDGHSLSGG